MNRIILFALIFMVLSCSNKKSSLIEPGTWRGVLELQDDQELPFIFKVENDTLIKVINAEEEIVVDEIVYKEDSIIFKMPVFEGYLIAKLNNGKLNGSFTKPNLNRVVPFYAEKSNSRFDIVSKTNYDISGQWETVFSQGIENDEYIAKGVFNQEGNIVTGTFRTTTGDYRFLEGVIDGDQLKLSTFDGAHAFLFNATVSDSTLSGTFYSGNHWKEPFIAKRNENYELPNSNDLTFLKEGFDKISFSFPNENGQLITLDDERFKDKVILVQIMGTWCPNCLDESKYYSKFYNDNNNKGLEIIALAFEYLKTEEAAFNNLKRLKDRVGIKYPMLLAQFGTTSKVKAQEKIPMLNHVLSYPTTIFIDRTGKVRKIHTGFNGPATGEKYDKFTSEFEGFVGELLKE